MKPKKTMAALLAAVMMTAAVPTTASAASANIPAPCYEIADRCVITLSASGNTLICNEKITSPSDSGVSRIIRHYKVQKHWGLWIWNDVEGQTLSIYSRDIQSAKDSWNFEDLPVGTYRVYYEVKLQCSDGTEEVITGYTNECVIS